MCRCCGWFAKRTGARTSRIVDPPNGRIPPLTPEAEKAAATDREFRLALLQATDTCKSKSAACTTRSTTRSPAAYRRARGPQGQAFGGAEEAPSLTAVARDGYPRDTLDKESPIQAGCEKSTSLGSMRGM
jgi:hypothetical protein